MVSFVCFSTRQLVAVSGTAAMMCLASKTTDGLLYVSVSSALHDLPNNPVCF